MKIESNKNWTTCLRLNTGDGSPRVFLLNSHFLGSVPKAGVLVFCVLAFCLWSWVRAHRTDVHFPKYPHDCKQSLALLRSSDSVLSVRPHILVVEFAKAETQAFLALSARLYKSLTAKLEPSSSLSAFAHILVVLQIFHFRNRVVFLFKAVDDLV